SAKSGMETRSIPTPTILMRAAPPHRYALHRRQRGSCAAHGLGGYRLVRELITEGRRHPPPAALPRRAASPPPAASRTPRGRNAAPRAARTSAGHRRWPKPAGADQLADERPHAADSRHAARGPVWPGTPAGVPARPDPRRGRTRG